MDHDDVALRPLQEDDLDQIARFFTDPEAAGEFEWTGFENPRKVRSRWEKDRWISAKSTWLGVTGPARAFAGIVSWRDRSAGPLKGSCFEIGICLLPEHRGHGVGTAAQGLLVDYLFDNTTVHRLQAFTEVENKAEQRALEKVGFQREGVLRELFFRAGKWRDSVLYARLRD